MKRIFLTLFASIFSICLLNAQSTISAIVIQVENGKAYLDVTADKAKVGDVFSIKEDAGYMIHPVTKEKIKREGEIMADLEIVETHAEYSVATIYPETAIDKIKPGMKAEMPEVAAPTEIRLMPEQPKNLVTVSISEGTKILLKIQNTQIPTKSTFKAIRQEFANKPVQFYVLKDVIVDGATVVPCGAVVNGVIRDVGEVRAESIKHLRKEYPDNSFFDTLKNGYYCSANVTIEFDNKIETSVGNIAISLNSLPMTFIRFEKSFQIRYDGEIRTTVATDTIIKTYK